MSIKQERIKQVKTEIQTFSDQLNSLRWDNLAETAYIHGYLSFFTEKLEHLENGSNGRTPALTTLRRNASLAGNKEQQALLEKSTRARIGQALQALDTPLGRLPDYIDAKTLAQSGLPFDFGLRLQKRFHDILRLWKFRETQWRTAIHKGSVTKELEQFIHTFYQTGGEVEKIRSTGEFGVVVELYRDTTEDNTSISATTLLATIRKEFKANAPIDSSLPLGTQIPLSIAGTHDLYLSVDLNKKAKGCRLNLLLGVNTLKKLLEEVKLEEPFKRPTYLITRTIDVEGEESKKKSVQVPVQTVGEMLEYSK